MKKWLAIFLVITSYQVHAQNSYSSTIKIGGGYVRDFPGLGGYGIFGEYAHLLSDNLEGSFGIKRLDMNGHPRTSTVREYTKATTLDFNIFFLPFGGETSILKVGAGYSFSLFNTRRSYPVFETHNTEKAVSWPTQDVRGRSSGITFTGEYQYIFPSNISLGLKASFCKAYDRVFYIGPYLGLKL